MSDPEIVVFPVSTEGKGAFSARVREVFGEHLLRVGLTRTRQRDTILDTLLRAERHLTLDQIYEAVKGRGIGRVTVFRTLKLLESAGLVNWVHDRAGRPRYEIKRDRPHHDHLVCLGCGAILEVQWPEIERIQARECRRLGFAPEYHRHEVFGRCVKCGGGG